MKVLFLAWEAPEDFALREDKGEKFKSYMGQWRAFSQAMEKSGMCESSHALEAPTTATTVTIRDGVRTVEDGPYPDAKEQLGGVFILDVPDMKTAAELAAKCPSANTGFVDIRPVPFLEAGENQ